MKIVMENGYVIQDTSDLTFADFDDAVGQHEDHENCISDFEGYFCTRTLAHTGPHISATGPDSITAIWESNSPQ